MIPIHAGLPPAPHDLWSAWAPDPLAAMALATMTLVYAAGVGRRRVRLPARRDVLFGAGLLAVGLALLSPLDTASAALASAHMTQHLLLTLVAAPLLTLARPGATLMQGLPRPLRRGVGRARVRLGLTRQRTDLVRRPVPALVFLTATLWTWHGSVAYQASLQHAAWHWLEHAMFLAAGILFWAVVVDAARGADAAPAQGVLLLFGAAMQGVFLSALLTFADTPFYPGYLDSTAAWGLTPIDDQRLAGALLWIVGGVVHLPAALTLWVRWIAGSDEPRRPAAPQTSTKRPAMPTP